MIKLKIIKKILGLYENFGYIFENYPWMFGKIPMITISFIEHLLKVISKMTMEIVLKEIKKYDEDFYDKLE